MYDNVVSLLRQCHIDSRNHDVVTIRHVMQPAYHTIGQDAFMTQSIAVMKERISALLIIGYHSGVNVALLHQLRHYGW